MQSLRVILYKSIFILCYFSICDIIWGKKPNCLYKFPLNGQKQKLVSLERKVESTSNLDRKLINLFCKSSSYTRPICTSEAKLSTNFSFYIEKYTWKAEVMINLNKLLLFDVFVFLERDEKGVFFSGKNWLTFLRIFSKLTYFWLEEIL